MLLTIDIQLSLGTKLKIFKILFKFILRMLY